MIDQSDPCGQRSRRDLLGALGAACLTAGTGCLGPDTVVEDPTSKRTSGDTGDNAETTGPRGVELGVEAFEDLAALEAVGGRLAANTERQITGAQCAALKTDGDGAWLHLPLTEPVDFSNARPACHVAIDGRAAGDFLYLDLVDADGNRFRTRTVVRSQSELVSVDFGILDPQVDETPVELERITRLSFRPGPRNEAGPETVYLDHPRRIPGPETAKVIFQFDDGNETDLTEALPYLSQYGYPAITYVNTNRVGNDGKLDEAQLAELRDAGWLVGSHTPDHTDLATVSDSAEVERRLREAKEWLVDRGFDEGARHFAYPYNSVTEEVLSVVEEVHDTGRVSSWQPVALPSNLQLIPAEGDPTPSAVSELLEWTVKYGGVLTVLHHSLSTDDEVAAFRDIVNEVRQYDRLGDVDVIRLDELELMVKRALS
jgi:peptidoglycan/xylan/chitin deacetylase (PgdA/CDA1 family)